MNKVLTIKDFGYDISKTKSDILLLSLMENVSNLKYFVKEGLDLDDYKYSQFNRLTLEEREHLVEEVSQSNIERAEFILEHSNDKLVKEVRLTKGDVTKFKYYNILKSMLEDLNRSAINNQEVIKCTQILDDLEHHKQTYMAAFSKNNVYKKAVFFSSFLTLIYSTIKEHLMHIDVSDSKNQGNIVMINASGDYVTTDKDTMKALDANLIMLKAKPTEDRAMTESFFGAGILAATGFMVAKTGITSFIIPAAKIALSALGALAALYLITRFTSKPLIEYLESYEYIKDIAKKGSLESDRAIVRAIDKMVGMKQKLLSMWKTDKSKNLAEYMKDLSKDAQVIQQYASKKVVKNKEDNKVAPSAVSNNVSIDNSFF